MTVALFLEQILNGLQLGVMLFLMAAGLTLIFGVMGLINLAHGSLFMVGGFVCAAVAAWTGSFWIGLIASLAAAAALGALVEIVVIRRLYDRDHLDQVLATFALVLMFSEGVRFVFGSFPLYLDPPAFLSGPVMLPGGLPYPAYRLAIIIAGLVVAAGLGLLITKTRLGMQIRAGEADREMIAALGVDIRFLYTVVFALGAALAGFAGALVGAHPVGAGRHGRTGPDPGFRGHRHRRHRLDPRRAGCGADCRRGRHARPFPAADASVGDHGSLGCARRRLGACLDADLSLMAVVLVFKPKGLFPANA
jgi:branched-chain amino acid transport system permease protein